MWVLLSQGQLTRITVPGNTAQHWQLEDIMPVIVYILAFGFIWGVVFIYLTECR